MLCKIAFYQTQFLPCQTLLGSDAWLTLPSPPFQGFHLFQQPLSFAKRKGMSEERQLRDVFRNKKRYYVGIIPTWADPPPPPVWEFFRRNAVFFLKMSQKKFFFENKICFLAPQDDFGMQKKNLVNKHKQVGMGQTPPPSMGNIPT